MPRIST